MGFILESILLELALGVILVFWLFYAYMTAEYSYWKNRSIAYKEPSFPLGTDKIWGFFQKTIGQHTQSIYTEFDKEKFVGLFQLRKPYLLVRDPELLKNIMTKDFHHFVDRGLMDPDLLPPILKHLFNIQGEPWKIMRNKLTPAFTSGKMKTMFYLMEACSNELVKALEPIAEKNEKIAIKHFIACFTTDVIASCAFGLESNSIKNPDNEFMRNGNKIFQSPTKLMMVKLLIALIFPWLFKKLRPFELFDYGSEDFFTKLVDDTVTYREKNNVVRHDFIDILIKIKNNQIVADNDNQVDVEDSQPGLTLNEMTAQAVLFFSAGFETSASTLSFLLYEISVNPEIQTKTRKEIDAVLIKHNGKVNYQALQEMVYVEAVVNETLRRYASLPILNRQCTEDYKLPGTKYVIPKGMRLIIPAYAIHHDPAYHPDPYKFDPERFTQNKIKTRNNYTFMPFGEGPRMCIGSRFAMMQMKMCLSMLLHNFELTVTEDTPIPLGIDPKQFNTTPASPIILRISKRKEA